MTGGVFMKKGTPHFLYTNKDSPDYVAPFAPFYSDRQKAILSGELSVEEVELRELGRLRNKARNMGDEENLEIANILYEEKSNPSAGIYKHYTAEEAAVNIGEVTADVPVICETEGTVGNGYAPGQINTLVDVDNVMYFSSCANVETSHSGAERATDDEYYELMRAGLEAFSTAGPKGAYEYHAKAVSTSIADVCAINPKDKPGYVNIFAIMTNGEIADDGTKNAILAACNDDKVRPLTDVVEVLDPLVVEFSVDLTYYIDRNSEKSAAEIEAAIRSAIEEYVEWQCRKIGRDINPSRLMWLLKDTGAKRVDIKSPVFVSLRDGSDRLTPQVAHTDLAKSVITNGGYEDE